MHQTLQDVRDAFESAGVSVSEWADAHGFRRENVYALLAGRTKGRRGQAHRIAAALGLKREIDLPHLLAIKHGSPHTQPETDGRSLLRSSP